MSENLTANIILSNNNYGLTKDAKILCKFLEESFRSNKNIKVKVRPVNYYCYETGHVDINFFLEIPNPLLLHYAKVNILIPNQEWFYRNWIEYLDNFDYIWCKTDYARSIFEKLVDKQKVKFIGWISDDMYAEKYSNYQKTFLHIGGKSPYKGTQNIIDSWKDSYPHLTIISQSNKISSTDQSNITLMNKRLDDDKIKELMNTNLFHLCLSECEGFGHYIYESLSAKALPFITNSEPMTDIITDSQYKIDVDKYIENDQFLDKRAIFCRDSLDTKVKEILKLNDNDLSNHRKNSRTIYLNNLRFFRKAIRDNLLDIKQCLSDNYIKKIPKEISSKVDDLPFVSILTLTYNRKEFFPLMEGNFTGIDYPRDKLEWIIVDDSDDGTILDFSDKEYKHQINYIKLESRLTVGEKRNIGVKNSKYEHICCMDDDDIYFPRNLLIRLAYLKFYNKKCCYCSSIASFHINKIISHINVPPFPAPYNLRVSDASLCFTKDFWMKKKFDENDFYESKGFITNRYNDCVEIPWTNIFISLLHDKNISNRGAPNLTPSDKPNGCHFNLSDELFTYLTNLQK